MNVRDECWNAHSTQKHWGRSIENNTTNIKNKTNPEGIDYKIQQCFCVCVICKPKYIGNSIKYSFILYQESCWAYRCMHIITKNQIFLLLSLRNKTLHVKSNSYVIEKSPRTYSPLLWTEIELIWPCWSFPLMFSYFTTCVFMQKQYIILFYMLKALENRIVLYISF